MNDTGPEATTASPSTGDLAANYRGEFPILKRKTYLNSNSLGALSRRSVSAHAEYERLWNEMGAGAWYEIWWSKLEQVRAQFGMTIGAPADSIALMPSVSGALAAVSGGLQAAGDTRRKIVITSLDFPTLGHHYYSREALGYEVVVVQSHDGVTVPLEAIRNAVDEDTLILATSHVFFTSGTVQDARHLAEIAHESGAYILLDAYQSNGQIPINVKDVGVDFLTSGGLKWLCGGPGAAYLYVDPNVDILPTTLSWFGVENQFGFELRAAPRTDARRFELGTPAVGCAYTASGGLSIVLEAGIERIAARNRLLSRDLRERLADAGFQLHQADGPDVRSALVLMEHVEASGAVAWMAENDVIVDSRGSLLRFSPHFYNTIDDNARAVEVLTDMPGAF